MSASSHPQSLSAYHQTLSDHMSTLLSRLPPAHDAAEASGTNPPARQAREQEFQLAWEAQGAAIHRALPSSFILQMDAASNAPRRTSANAESATARNDRHLKRIERTKRRIERWRARVNVDSLLSPSIPPTPLPGQCFFSTPTPAAKLASPALTQPAVAVFHATTLRPSPSPLAARRSTRCVDAERAALERQINEKLAAAAGAAKPESTETEVLDTLAHCLGLVAKLSTNPVPENKMARMSRDDAGPLQVL